MGAPRLPHRRPPLGRAVPAPRQIQATQTDSLWRQGDFLKFWLGQTVSQLGSRVTGFAVPMTAALVLDVSSAEMGVLSAVLYAPYAVVGLLAGVWIDRWRRRPLLIATDLGRAVILATIPIAALLGRLGIVHLALAGFLAGGLAVVGDVARLAYLPGLVARQRLTAANGRLTASWTMAGIVGPGLGGVLVQVLTAPLAIAADVLTFLVSAICLRLIRTPEPEPGRVLPARRAGREVLAGLRVVYHDPVLWAICVTLGLRNFFAAALTAVELLYRTRELHLAPAVLGSVGATAALVAPLGSLLAGRIIGRIGLGPAYAGAIVLGSIAQLPIVFAAGPQLTVVVTLLLALLVIRFTEPLWMIAGTTIVQSRTPHHLLGRIGGARRFITLGVVPLGFLAGGFLGEAAGLRAAFAAAVAGELLAGAWLLASPVRHLRRVSAEPPARCADGSPGGRSTVSPRRAAPPRPG